LVNTKSQKYYFCYQYEIDGPSFMVVWLNDFQLLHGLKWYPFSRILICITICVYWNHILAIQHFQLRMGLSVHSHIGSQGTPVQTLFIFLFLLSYSCTGGTWWTCIVFKILTNLSI
jgi:hypothetical protein